VIFELIDWQEEGGCWLLVVGFFPSLLGFQPRCHSLFVNDALLFDTPIMHTYAVCVRFRQL